MATDSEIRAWARDQGLDVPVRGNVPGHLRDAYEAYHGDLPPSADPLDDGQADDDESAAPPPPAERRQRERKPRTVKTPGTAGRLRSRWAGKTTPKKKHPRVPVDDLIAGVWRAAAGFLTPLPATARVMKFQAPVAGLLLEDAVKDSAVDRLLQPLARAGKTGEAMFVLAGPPLMVAAIETDPRRAPFIMPVLRESLLRWCAVAGPKMTDAMKREREFEELYGQSVDEMMILLFGDGQADVPDDERVRQAQARMTPAAA
jgi:hypothetical protein